MLDLMGKATFTAEQISAMKSALDAYGLPMPQFKRIGGLLAEELPVDEAAFHAAIMAINDALDGPDASKTLKALNNPNACLQDVDPDPGNIFSSVDTLIAKWISKLTKFDLDPSKKYHLVLVASKEKKVRAANNKSFDLDTKSIDVYDELLTQEEIQSHIDKINQLLALERVEGKISKKLVAVRTVWKFHDFPITQILREMNFGESRSSKTAVFAFFEGLSV